LLKATLRQLLIVVCCLSIVSDVTPAPPLQELPHHDKDAGGGRIVTPPPPRATAAPAPSPAPRRGSSFSSPPHYFGHAEPWRSATWPMINAVGCGAKSSPSGGAVVPVRGRARRRRPGPGGPPCGGVAKGVVPGSGVGGGGGGAGLRCSCRHHRACKICQRHRRPDAGSHRPGPAPVRGMAWRMPVPRGRDKGCCRRPAAEGPSLQLWPGGASR
jgi:hypothetical protein